MTLFFSCTRAHTNTHIYGSQLFCLLELLFYIGHQVLIQTVPKLFFFLFFRNVLKIKQFINIIIRIAIFGLQPSTALNKFGLSQDWERKILQAFVNLQSLRWLSLPCIYGTACTTLIHTEEVLSSVEDGWYSFPSRNDRQWAGMAQTLWLSFACCCFYVWVKVFFFSWYKNMKFVFCGSVCLTLCLPCIQIWRSRVFSCVVHHMHLVLP